MFHVNHYIPSLGSPSAGCSQFTESIQETLESVEHSLLHMSEDDTIVIERAGGEDEY